MRFRQVLCLLFVFILSIASVGCGNAEQEISKKESLSFSVPGAVTGQQNPFYARQSGDREMLAAITMTYASSGDVAQWEAEEKEDGSFVVTLTITKDLYCSKGAAISIHDFVYAVQLVCDPSYDGPYTALAESSLVGLSEFRLGQVQEIAGLERVDAHSCRIRFAEKEDYLTLLDLPMVYTANYGSYVYGACAEADIVAKYAAVIGAGPYGLDKLYENDGKMTVLAPNARYYKGVPTASKVTLRHVDEQDVGLNMHLGQLTAGFLYDVDEAKRQAKQYGYEVIILANGAFLYDKDDNYGKKLSGDLTVVQAVSELLSSL